MSSVAYQYPPSPANVPASISQPSVAFKKEVSKVMGAILVFFIVYIILILLAVGLAAVAVYLGFALIVAHPSFLTIMLGLGLVGLGIMVFVFLVKFIFAVSKFDHSGSIEVTEADQPRLFAFIRQLTKETQTPFPKRIFISPDVNACVFYDSGFWSMFLPVKKNLQIGLGLVNAVNVSEFKAIMAHEFGHFSQRSMKLGSFVYNVNRVIYNMLFENKGYARSLQSWAEVSGYFAFFASLTAHIVNGIQWVLGKMYGLINKSYMGLSREMEFHADSVAASVSGTNTAISALRRVEFAASCYNTALEKCNELFKEQLISSNVYPNQRAVAQQFIKDNSLRDENGLPVIHDGFLKTQHQNRVNFKDQWASHPALEERETHLRSLQIEAAFNTEDAWVLFETPGQLQQQLTTKIYEPLVLPENVQVLDAHAFEKRMQNDIALYSLPEAYNGYYNKRRVATMDVRALSAEAASPDSFADIFSPEHLGLQKKINAMEADVLVLNAIADKKIITKTFDFDGEKYHRSQASEMATNLENELKGLKQLQESVDKRAFKYFYHRALALDAAKAGQLKDAYIDFFQWQEQSELFLKNTGEMLEGLQPFYSGNSMTIDEVHGIVEKLKADEVVFKNQLRNWDEAGAFNGSQVAKEKIQQFRNSRYSYYSATTLFHHEFTELHDISNDAWNQIINFLFMKFKNLLEMQQAYITNNPD